MTHRLVRFSALAAMLALAWIGSAEAAVQIPDGFVDVPVIGGLEFPVGCAFLKDGRLLVVEQKTARVRLVVNGGFGATDPLMTVDSVQTAGNEQGLLGVAVDPAWPGRPYIYLYYDAFGSRVRISRFRASGDLDGGSPNLTLDPLSRRDVIRDILDVRGNHNGGTIRFGPDGMLYAATGEDGTPCGAQDTTSMRGVMLRMNVSLLPDGPGPPNKPLIAPPDNPLASHSNVNARLLWAMGFRNPYRFHIDDDGRIFVADVGQDRYEEVDLVDHGGRNFGWPYYEANAAYTGSCSGIVTPSALTFPIYYYDRTSFPSMSAAIVSGGVYRPAACGGFCFPNDYVGDYFLTDFYRGFLRRLKFDGSSWKIASPVAGQPNATDWGAGFDEIGDFAVGPDGALWYVRAATDFMGSTGEIRKIQYVPDVSAPRPGDSGVTFAPPVPSPARGPVRLEYTIERAARVELSILDLAGRNVRTLAGPETKSAGRYVATWDGRDARGKPSAGGVYMARLTVDGVSLVRRVLRIR